MTTLPTLFKRDEFLPWLTTQSIGLDNLFNRVFDDFSKTVTNEKLGYPPYNIIKDEKENCYHLEIAVAGYDPKQLSVYIDKGQLIIESIREEKTEKEERNFIYRGIAKRQFKKVFDLSENASVVDAEYDNGLLKVKIQVATPEETRKIIQIKK